jgi:hypothetical protein
VALSREEISVVSPSGWSGKNESSRWRNWGSVEIATNISNILFLEVPCWFKWCKLHVYIVIQCSMLSYKHNSFPKTSLNTLVFVKIVHAVLSKDKLFCYPNEGLSRNVVAINKMEFKSCFLFSILLFSSLSKSCYLSDLKRLKLSTIISLNANRIIYRYELMLSLMFGYFQALNVSYMFYVHFIFKDYISLATHC